MVYRGQSTRTLAAPPDAVFAQVTDLAALDGWNDAMTEVAIVPDALEEGAEWVVQFRAFGQEWRSRSRVLEHDAEKRHFSYRSHTCDGNVSWAIWTWQVEDHPDGSVVRVSYELHPQTFWRKYVLARIRHHQLRRTELPASLSALGEAALARVAS